MPLLQPTLSDIMNAISAHNQKFDKIDKRFDDLTEVIQTSFTHVDEELRDIRSKMATKEDLKQLKQELRQELQEVKQELKADIKQLGHQQQMTDRDLETTRLRLKHLETNP